MKVLIWCTKRLLSSDFFQSLYKQHPLKAQANTDIPSLPCPRCMLLLARRDTWSKACWVGIFQNVTIPSIMSGRQPRTALAALPTANICTCLTQTAEVLAPLLDWWTDPAAPHASQLYGGGGGVRVRVRKEGVQEASHSQKNIYQAGATVTNQRRLENMISPREECECWGMLRGCCTSCAWWDQGRLQQL